MRQPRPLAHTSLGLSALALAAGCTPTPARVPFDFREGPLVESSAPAVPITGGTLLVTADRTRAVAADPERDLVSLVDLTSGVVRATVTLPARSEPGRIVEDPHGRAHVALRRGGGVAHIDLATGTLLGTSSVCPAPRGLAWDRGLDALYVACQTGELVTLDRTGAEVARVKVPGGDLRDVIVRPEGLLVTHFRSAKLSLLAEDGTVRAESTPPADFGCRDFGGPGFVGDDSGGAPRPAILPESPFGGDDASIAWRTIALPSSDAGGDVLMLHQRAQSDAPISIDTGGYGGTSPCNDVPGIVHTSLSIFGRGTEPVTTRAALPEAVLAVDVAVSPDGTQLALAMPGNASTPFAQVNTGALTDFLGGVRAPRRHFSEGQVTAVAFAGRERLLVQSREPATLSILTLDRAAAPVTVRLSDESRADTGHYLFHAGATAMVACASCHAEGGDDARTWDFDGIGPRRTQAVAGGLLGTEPFHWNGDMADFRTLEHQVFGRRMGAGEISTAHADALGGFVDGLRPVPAPEVEDADAVLRGQQLFESEEVGCASCHGGPMLTNNASVDVGTGGVFQVPTLVGLAHHAPYMHDGRARTLHDRFDPTLGGGEQHGHTAHLSRAEIDDLVAYLLTL
jgi:mono/diheme cytochrome c family protein/DNA-binding beta-propeller fold protein YncE